MFWVRSSVGRALPSHGRGRAFESRRIQIRKASANAGAFLYKLKIAHKKASKPISIKAKDVCWVIRPAGMPIIHVTLDISVDQCIQRVTFLTGLYGAGRFVNKGREKR